MVGDSADGTSGNYDQTCGPGTNMGLHGVARGVRDNGALPAASLSKS